MVTDHWLPRGLPGREDDVGPHQIVVDDSLSQKRPLMLLVPAERSGILWATSAAIERLGLTGQTKIDSQSLARALKAARMQLNGADHMFYLPVEKQSALQAERVSSATRQLHEDDADAFAVLSAGAPAEDLDEAFVELDHWLVFGTFVGDRLASVASMFPWRNTHLADLGIITDPAFRGRGLARATVRAVSAAALDRGYEPQYRCQLDNAPSVALARSAGFEHFGTWDVLDSEPPE